MRVYSARTPLFFLLKLKPIVLPYFKFFHELFKSIREIFIIMLRVDGVYVIYLYINSLCLMGMPLVVGTSNTIQEFYD